MATLFSRLPLTLKTLADFPTLPDVIEDGATFAENAEKKATQQATALGHWVIAEDSGLSVDFLNGAPGTFSARFAGEPSDDVANNSLLLKKLEGVPQEKRTAFYTCHFAIAAPDGTIRGSCQARCCGRIAVVSAGTHGFGYDPLFEIIEYQKTFGQLPLVLKHLISHRARAARRLIPLLESLLPHF